MLAMEDSTLLLTREFMASRVPLGAFVTAVRGAFAQLAAGQVEVAPVTGPRGFDGTFHVKAATSLATPRRVVIKLNANFPANPLRHGLPTIQGVIALFDAECGRLLALLDSAEVTAQRTAAASVVAAQLLARSDARRLALIGCGTQARYHLAAFHAAYPLRSVVCHDLETPAAHRLAALATACGLDATVADSPHTAAIDADIVVTSTSSCQPVLRAGDVRDGCFVAAVGADNPAKHEIAVDLMQRAQVVPDVLAQALAMGDLHHAVATGSLRADDVYGELADIVCGRIAGRSASEQVFLFDSTGTAIADLAAAEVIFGIACADPSAPRFRLAA